MAKRSKAHGGKILLEHSIGETRAVALDANDAAFALYIERTSDAGRRVRLGDVCDGTVRAIAPKQGAVFVALESGIEVVLRYSQDEALTEGQAIAVQIVSEAFRDKMARATLHSGVLSNLSAFECWLSDLPVGYDMPIEDVASGDVRVAEVFERALEPAVTLPGGGRMTLSPTPALTAIDIDTAGRNDSGRAANRALKVNRQAVVTLAREISLRRLGGLIVLDCVAPLNRDAGEKVRDAFVTTHNAVSARHVNCLRPSPLGLMELSIQRREAPLHDLILSPDGSKTPESVCLDAMRHLAVEARAEPMAALTLSLPEAAKMWFDDSGQNLQESIDRTYGARISVIESNQPIFEIFKQ